MKLSITFPMRVASLNVSNRGAQWGRAAKVKKQRADVRIILDSQLPKLRRFVPDGSDRAGATSANVHRVTFTRIAWKMLDQVNVAGGFKAIEDETAAWCGVKDGDRARWGARFLQRPTAKGFDLVRIEIEDADPDDREVIIVRGAQPSWIGDVIDEQKLWASKLTPAPTAAGIFASRLPSFTGASGPSFVAFRARPAIHRDVKPPNLIQPALIFRPAYYADPLDQADEDVVLTPMKITAEPPPRTLVLTRRIDGHPYTSATLQRSLEHDDELGEYWLYSVPGGGHPAQRQQKATTESRATT